MLKTSNNKKFLHFEMYIRENDVNIPCILLYTLQITYYSISSNKCLQSYAKRRQGVFLLFPICKAKCVLNFPFLFVLEILFMPKCE